MRTRFPAQATELPGTNELPAAWLEGEVEENRLSFLHKELRRTFGEKLDPTLPIIPLGDQIFLPNPLEALPRLLSQQRAMNIATIHGDFNLENILIEPETNTVSLIDFADARKDPVLHDLLRLETEMTTRLLPEVLHKEQLPLLPTLAGLYWRLHGATLSGTSSQPTYQPPVMQSPALQKLWEMLYATRKAARSYCVDPNDLTEYYQGLVIYLIGALKFKNLSNVPEAPLPKQIAFWGATLINAALNAPLTPGGEHDPFAPYLATLLTQLHAPLPVASTVDSADAAPTPVIAKLAAAQARLAALPTEWIATLGALPTPSRMPYNRNPLFVGRAHLLIQLANHFHSCTTKPASALLENLDNNATPQLQPAPVAIIAGLGGMGKSQLASEFVHRYGRFFAGGVYWLSMADARAVPAEISACGRGNSLNLRPDFDSLSLEEQGRLVRATWQEPMPRLLVFDNCEEPALLAQYRPTSGGCCVLVTSRRGDWAELPDSTGLSVLPLEVLARSESVALLHEHRPEVDQPLLGAIAEEVGDLPLALHLAGSYLGRYRGRLAAQEYLHQLRASVTLEHPSLQSGGLSPTDHEQNVERTIALSFNQLDPKHPTDGAALAILTHVALLAPGEPIPLDLLALLIPARPGPGKNGTIHSAIGEQPLGEPISRLAELGLARLDADANLRLHRLVILYLQKALASELANTRPQIEAQLCQEAERLNSAGYPTALLKWQVHLRAVVIQAFDRNDELSSRVCHALGEHFRQVGDYERALRVMRRVVEINQACWGEQSTPAARALTALGYILFLQDDLKPAKGYYEAALAIQNAHLGDHLETAETLNHLGLLHQNMGHLRAARRCHRRALRIRLRLLGENHPLVAHSLCNLAYLDYTGKQFVRARDYLERALTIQNHSFGNQHPETIRVMHNLGELLRDQGDLPAAQEIIAQVLALQEQVLATDHPENARALVNLGNIAREDNRLEDAKVYFTAALVIQQKVLGEDHTSTAFTLWMLGATLAALGDLPQARHYGERALKVFLPRHGPDHWFTQGAQRTLQEIAAK